MLKLVVRHLDPQHRIVVHRHIDTHLKPELDNASDSSLIAESVVAKCELVRSDEGGLKLRGWTVNYRSLVAARTLPTDVGGVTKDRTVAFNCTDASYTGHPATSVPMGLDDHGVPTGIQIIAPRFRDDLALGLAARLQQIQPWPLIATGYSIFDV